MSVSAKTRSLLLVEDDEEDVWVTKRAFEELEDDLRLDVCIDGDRALAHLAQGVAVAAATPDLVILDLNLPKLHGIQVLERLKADPALSHIPVIVLTTSSLDPDVRRAYAAGASAYLVKPSSMEEYREMARSISRFFLHTATLPT